MATAAPTSRPAGVDQALLHFTSFDEDPATFPVIVSASGTRVTDDRGRVYLDGLAGLYTTQVGHGREELVQAAAAQMRTLDFFPSWSAHHPPGLALTARLSALAPVEGPASAFFVSSGSEAVEAAIKLCRQYHAAQGRPDRNGFVTRASSYHGTTAGALALTGLPDVQAPFLPLMPGVVHVPNTGAPDALEALEAALLAGPPEAIAAVVLEPVQNSGGCLVPDPGYWPRVRELCDEHGILLVADATICAFGRLGTWFGIERFGVQPDIITFAKGLTSGYVPMGGVLISARVREALGTQGMFVHGSTFGGHPVAAAVALANLDLIESEGLLDRVRGLEDGFGATLHELAAAHPMVRAVRGMGFFWALELDTSWGDGRALEGEDYDRHFKVGLFHRLLELGLICRVDDRESPVLQFSPALVATAEELRELVAITGTAIGELEAALGWTGS